ncbi:MAG: hydrogenase formation protein HypD [Candidatus Omnitrophica bacterium]|nr:hydrogenase formation protein HypD [Candidatus Omnitrophota bacterium]
MIKGKIKLMEVCGTHTMAIAASGIKKVLPKTIELISGPGCPVCVTSQSDIDRAVEIARIKDVIMVTFGDMMRVRGSFSSLDDVRRKGKDVRIVYSCLDALIIAQENPEKRVVFMGVGFETTSPTVAASILEAKRQKIKNFFVLANFKLIFPALEALSKSKKVKVDGFICPGHVSVVTGIEPYKRIARRFKKPCVITGFADSDIIKGIKILVDQIKKGKPKAEIAYRRAVKEKGNTLAQKTINRVFVVRDSFWRGLGLIKESGLKLKESYACFDAEKEFKVRLPKTREPKGCLCGKVLQGIKSPSDCRLFGKVCTPSNPVGPCMVSSEGTCAAYYKYGV